MASSNSSSTSSKTKKNAQDALDRFKMEVASEIGVNLKEGYNGDLTSGEHCHIVVRVQRLMSQVQHSM